jgi:hypothetical protein
MHGPTARSSSLRNSQCTSQPTPATSSNVASKAPASQRQRSFTVHGLDTSKSTLTPQINVERDFPIRVMPKRHSKGPSPRRVHAEETILKLKQDLHNLLSTPLGSGRHHGRSPDQWGSNIATPSHSRHYSLNCDTSGSKANILEDPDSKQYSRARGHLPKPKAKGYVKKNRSDSHLPILTPDIIVALPLVIRALSRDTGVAALSSVGGHIRLVSTLT